MLESTAHVTLGHNSPDRGVTTCDQRSSTQCPLPSRTLPERQSAVVGFKDTAGTDDILVAWHETNGRNGVVMPRERLRILPLVLRVPDLDE